MVARRSLAVAIVMVFVVLIVGCCPAGPSVHVMPSEVEVVTGGSVAFTARVQCLMNPIVTWSATCGVIGEYGRTMTYTAPPEPGSCTVTVASVIAPDFNNASALVTVVAAAEEAAVMIEPGTAALVVNGTQEFTAVVTGATDTRVTWDAAPAWVRR